MNSLVVYESRFGDTAMIAQVVADALHDRGAARSLSVQDATAADLDGVDLLVVGGPTHAHGISAALGQWLGHLAADELRELPVAAFDTRYHLARILSGSAARGITRWLRDLGARPIAAPESFFVLGSEGPLADGELERAAIWARALSEECMAPDTRSSTVRHRRAAEHWQPHP